MSHFPFYVAVMILGALGCAARMALADFFAYRYQNFPVGTVLVNVLGCFIIGAFFALTRVDHGLQVSPIVRQAVMVGFLGGFTTFSSFALQTLALASEGKMAAAVLNVVLSVTLCLVAVWAGNLLGLQYSRD